MIRDTLRRPLSLCQEKTTCKNTCTICQQPFNSIKRKFSLCDHAQSMCSNCCHQMIDIAIYDKNLPKCPHCHAQMLTQDSEDSPSFYNHLPISKKEKLDNFFKQLQKGSKIKTRFCEIVGCEGLLNNGICIKCGTVYCQKCFEKDHSGKCKSQSSIQEIQQTQNIKKCPQCKTLLQREGGCLQFTCGNCHYIFCFKCKQPWSPKHHACDGITSGFDAVKGFFAELFK